MSAAGRRAFILCYRRGSGSQSEHYVLLEVEGVRSREEASHLVGRKVVWVRPDGRSFVGRIVRAHGGRGRVIARFRRPLPGQALGTQAVVL